MKIFFSSRGHLLMQSVPQVLTSPPSPSSSSFLSRLWGFGEKSVKALVSCYGNRVPPHPPSTLPSAPFSSCHQGPWWCFHNDVIGELLEPCLLRKITDRQGNNAENNFFPGLRSRHVCLAPCCMNWMWHDGGIGAAWVIKSSLSCFTERKKWC